MALVFFGNQDNSRGVIGLLEVIETDFDRTIRTTTRAEENASAEFVEFEKVSDADISGKRIKEQHDQGDLGTAISNFAEGMEDLQTQMNLVDQSLRRIEELKPMCLDSGMSYEEGGAKRDEEIAALNRAMCILTPGGDAASCM